MPQPTPPLSSTSDAAAEKWAEGFLERRGLKPEDLSASDWFQVARLVPCHIRCWRVGGPVDVKPGDKCPECGKLCPTPTRYDLLTRED